MAAKMTRSSDFSIWQCFADYHVCFTHHTTNLLDPWLANSMCQYSPMRERGLPLNEPPQLTPNLRVDPTGAPSPCLLFRLKWEEAAGLSGNWVKWSLQRRHQDCQNETVHGGRHSQAEEEKATNRPVRLAEMFELLPIFHFKALISWYYSYAHIVYVIS